MARLEAADASFPVSVISGLYAELSRDLESEGTLYPKPESIAKFWLAVQCALEQHASKLCMLGLWPSDIVEH
eukprot:5418519-Pleurochrysis_carterae.AAC.1